MSPKNQEQRLPPAHIIDEVRSLGPDNFNTWLQSSPFIDRIRRLDTYFSFCHLVSGDPIEEMIEAPSFRSIESYLSKMLSEGYLGRFGRTVAPHCFTLDFPKTGITYHWIPKNSCTSTKKLLLKLEPGSAEANIKKHLFHETVQDAYGKMKIDYVQGGSLKRFALIREPISRIVSCYLDKFALPTHPGRTFEPFILGHISKAQEILNLKKDTSRSLTFSEFIAYIDLMPGLFHDSHWLPQSAFLPKQYEEFLLLPNNRLDLITKGLGLTETEQEIPRANVRGGGDITVSMTGNQKCLADTLPTQIPKDEMSDYSRYLTSSLKAYIQHLYADDFNLYQKSIETAKNIDTE